ncbi:flagellar basal body-associated FliL family protein [Chitinilyticum litopenaei]|uniref:flagellar basal body-associated FliL family protein n=1 Tax=Chitinilyticum litopenaei TaxID=1121276 RepID=UPI000400776C|nr:flagellar basal body-associated FliL family protein [Chitinilyticum litopenaei]
MSEAKAEAAAPSKKGKLLLIIVIVLLTLLLAMGGALLYFIMKPPADGGADEAVAEAQAHDEKKEKKKPKKKEEGVPPVYEKLQADPFTVNLSGEGDSVLQVEIFVELADETDKQRLKEMQPKVQSAVIRLIGSKTLDEVRTTKGQEDLARQIREQINLVLEAEGKDEGVLSVNFTKYFYQ